MGKHRKISVGDIIENLEVLENLGYRKYCGENTTYWKCRCTRCNSICEIPQKNLGKAQKDCGCWRKGPKAVITPGTIYGRLKVIELGPLSKKRYTYLCECSCPAHTRIYVRGDLLRSGEVKSCGCIHDELFQEKSKKGRSNCFIGGTHKSQILDDSFAPQKNSTSGYRGVSWHKSTKKWAARIQYRGKHYHLGYFDNPEDASDAYKAAAERRKEDFLEWYTNHYPPNREKEQYENDR